MAIIKDSVTYGSGADVIFFPCPAVAKVSESLLRNYFVCGLSRRSNL